MENKNDFFVPINEVAKELELPAHTLRYWEKQFAGAAGSQTAKIGGLKSAADIMNYLDSSTEAQLMNAIQSQDKDIGTQIQDLMFVFENLGAVDDRSIQT